MKCSQIVNKMHAIRSHHFRNWRIAVERLFKLSHLRGPTFGRPAWPSGSALAILGAPQLRPLAAVAGENFIVLLHLTNVGKYLWKLLVLRHFLNYAVCVRARTHAHMQPHTTIQIYVCIYCIYVYECVRLSKSMCTDKVYIVSDSLRVPRAMCC